MKDDKIVVPGLKRSDSDHRFKLVLKRKPKDKNREQVARIDGIRKTIDSLNDQIREARKKHAREIMENLAKLNAAEATDQRDEGKDDQSPVEEVGSEQLASQKFIVERVPGGGSVGKGISFIPSRVTNARIFQQWEQTLYDKQNTGSFFVPVPFGCGTVRFLIIRQKGLPIEAVRYTLYLELDSDRDVKIPVLRAKKAPLQQRVAFYTTEGVELARMIPVKMSNKQVKYVLCDLGLEVEKHAQGN